MTGIQWFAFVILPIGVAVFGAGVAWGSTKLIDLANRFGQDLDDCP
jgi:hypothetical protein